MKASSGLSTSKDSTDWKDPTVSKSSNDSKDADDLVDLQDMKPLKSLQHTKGKEVWEGTKEYHQAELALSAKVYNELVWLCSRCERYPMSPGHGVNPREGALTL